MVNTVLAGGPVVSGGNNDSSAGSRQFRAELFLWEEIPFFPSPSLPVLLGTSGFKKHDISVQPITPPSKFPGPVGYPNSFPVGPNLPKPPNSEHPTNQHRIQSLESKVAPPYFKVSSVVCRFLLIYLICQRAFLSFTVLDSFRAILCPTRFMV